MELRIRAFLAMPSRWWSPLLLGLGLGGILLAAFTFMDSSSALPYRIWTFFLPSSLHSQENPQQENPNPYFMPQLNQSVSSSDDQSSPVEAPLHHHTYPQEDSGFSSSAKSNPPHVNDTGGGRGNMHAFPPTSHEIEVADCDIYTGKWVEDDTYPLYKPDSCPYVAKKFNCQQNGRPDAKYTRWRWAPRDCELPRFSGRVMLENLRGKRLVFVGDSLNKNQWDSMLCMLSESLPDKSRIARHQMSNRILKFLDYNCSVEFYTARYLVDMKEGSNKAKYTIRLDTIDKSEKRWRQANVLVFNTAHWWGPGKIGKGENIFQVGEKVYGKLDVMMAYKKALLTWAKWVDTHVNPHITRVVFRAYSPQHFRGGKWDSGGHCEHQTEPIDESTPLTTYPIEMQVLEEVVQAMKVPVHVLNITNLSAYRKDAHPALYWHPQHVVQPHQDCGHWCLPGLPDTWNELLYFVLTKQMPTSP